MLLGNNMSSSHLDYYLELIFKIDSQTESFIKRTFLNSFKSSRVVDRLILAEYLTNMYHMVLHHHELFRKKFS